MKKTFCLALLLLVFLPAHAFPQEDGRNEPDSLYLEREDSLKNESGGLLDFLPFFGNKRNEIRNERLLPSPSPKASKPVLAARELNELKTFAGNWLLTSEITEPAVRKTEDDSYYRDYIVFDDEYTIEVMRGDSPEKPFIGYVYARGDYFQTAPHETAEEARSDFNFKYQPLDFRVIFERIEKWDYSTESQEAPIVFREQWVFQKLQSKAKAETSKAPAAPEAAAPPPELVLEPAIQKNENARQ
ncbi:MAG: hypothetical protein C4520_09110 [Candidatus Abyssobacteria bacterium SURF_5]|uniref:Uncharacterized protein n=1 Tax=Abyssobacteria bacterium (strain SURF_5) TaxID=2093360 RepID=A0A3A4NTD5_ABYX5|nr:MAG: hypothetical protein C4520_09110 [Candidatus Abyssubacteria bacterium SURF_5]